jgi:hypothetical protein
MAAARPHPARPSRQGLAELLLVTAFLALAAVGAVALFGDELRQALGSRPPPASPAPPAPPPSPAP